MIDPAAEGLLPNDESKHPAGAQIQHLGERGSIAYPGFTKRQLAAIALKVPDSGSGWLDAMIREAQREETARAVMAAQLARADLTVSDYDHVANRCRIAADELYPARPHTQD